MGVRNCEDLGLKLQLIMKRLLSNQTLLKLLYYSDKDPLSHRDFSDDEIKEEIYEKLIKITPRVGPKETAQSIVVVSVASGVKDPENTEFKNIAINVEVFVPLTQWVVMDDNLRPFLILGQLQSSLDGKKINGLGKMTGGDFELNFLTEEISSYI
jgi:hypothetical protein